MEVKYTNQKSKKRPQKKRKKSRFGILVIFLLILAVTFFVLLRTVLFPIDKITIKGDSIYTTEEIINASAVNKGDKLFGISEDKVNGIITKKLPYIKEVNLNKSLPGTLTISVIPITASYSIYHDNQYVITSDDYKFLEQSAEAKEDTINIKGIEITPNEIGDKISINDEDRKEAFLSLINSITKYEIKVTAADVSNLAQLKATVKNGITVNFGTAEDLDYKIMYLKGMLSNIEETAKGSIDLSNWTRSNPKGYFVNTEN